MILKKYTNPKDFLDAHGAALEKREMENNVLLGNCYNLIHENRIPENSYFLNASNDSVEANSIKVSPKIILSGTAAESVKTLFDFYAENKIDYKGVIGDSSAAELFAKLSGRKIFQTRVTLIQSLDKLSIPLSNTDSFQIATLSDLEVLASWTIHFIDAENLFPKRSPEDTTVFVKHLISQGNFSCWRENGKIVSMAAIIRKIKHAAIIGFVYTPKEYRGKGYAKKCTQYLSDYILKNNFKQSGLLVFNGNKIARKIYEDLGYKTVSELLDVDFE